MKTIIAAIFILSLASCNKDDASACYECKNMNGTANYQDVGCMTGAEWNSIGFTDANGNQIDKNANCRKR